MKFNKTRWKATKLKTLTKQASFTNSMQKYALMDFLSDAGESIYDGGKGFLNGLGKGFNSLGEGVYNSAQNLGNTATNLVKGDIYNAAQNLTGSVSDLVSGAIKGTGNVVKGTVDGAVKTLGSVPSAVGGKTVKDAVDTISKSTQGAIDTGVNTVDNTQKATLNTTGKLVGGTAQTGLDVTTKLTTGDVSGAWDSLKGGVRRFNNDTVNGVKNIFSAATNQPNKKYKSEADILAELEAKYPGLKDVGKEPEATPQQPQQSQYSKNYTDEQKKQLATQAGQEYSKANSRISGLKANLEKAKANGASPEVVARFEKAIASEQQKMYDTLDPSKSDAALAGEQYRDQFHAANNNLSNYNAKVNEARSQGKTLNQLEKDEQQQINYWKQQEQQAQKPEDKNFSQQMQQGAKRELQKSIGLMKQPSQFSNNTTLKNKTNKTLKPTIK
jgi:hypothetical protein